MKVYELLDSITVQGNVEVRRYDRNCGLVGMVQFRECDGLRSVEGDSCHIYDDLEVTYLFCEKIAGEPFLIIEVEPLD